MQDLYRDISRLIQLAHPGEGDELIKYVGVQSFINALDDRYLRLEVLKLRPADLEAAASHAIRLEVLIDSVDGKTTDSNDQGGGRSSTRPRTVFAVAGDKPDKDSDTDLLKRIRQLERELKQAHKGGKDSSSKKPSPKRGSGRNSAGRGDSASASGDGTRASPDNRPCFLCKEVGHWRKDCPKRRDKPKDEAGVQPVLAISANMSPTKIYVTAKVNGEPVKCLLDSGCERSVISADLAPKAKLTLRSLLFSQPTGPILTLLVTLLFRLSLTCLLYTSPSPRDRTRSRMPSSA